MPDLTNGRQENPDTLNDVFETLSDPIRRDILSTMTDHDPSEGAAFEPADLVRDDRAGESVEIRLKHVHLPRLAEAGYIEWDHTTNTLRRGPAFEDIEPVVELLGERPEALPAPWP